jgi:phage baseplate assembly protein gpV
VNVKASNVSVDSPETTLSGHLTVQGGITVSGGGGSSMTGDFTLNGSMNATNDVTASGISLNSHVHGGITAGGSDTSTPK